MDHRRLVELVKQSPPIWDRNCPQFRDKEAKEQAWDELASKIALSVTTCKDTFKSLREKYLREREKAQHQTEHYSPWDLLTDLMFLDPHIVPRAAVWNGNSASEDDVSINSDSDPTDFDKQLIHLVKEASPIWDRNSNTYPSKTSKNQLWENIGSALHRDANSCMLRWKALREKYIRQKAKFQEGEAKWELLDDLVFLDKVIQYRRQRQRDWPGSSTHPKRDTSEHSKGRNSYSYIRCNMDLDDYAYTDSSNDFLNIVKEENTVLQVADSSYNSKRLRDNSVGSYGEATAPEKRTRPEESSAVAKAIVDKEKTPEQLFGDLVASLLSKKPEVTTCKDTFKSLREKYLREREKAQHQTEHYSPWDLLTDLMFLDPHIVPRAAVWNGNSASEDDVSINSDSDPTDFDKQLIHLVKEASPIWDRNSNTYPSKTSKNQLWENIGSALHRDANSCMLRWKALREKYIRQKAKFQEGEAKWELLDDLVFLDKVIQYRRQRQRDWPGSSTHPKRDTSEHSKGRNSYSYIRCNMDLDDYAYTDSSNDFLNIVKEENTVLQVADSSYNSKRLRDNSVGSYGDATAPEKRTRPEESSAVAKAIVDKEKTPEQLFGDLVASLLSKKPEGQRNLYMIEIMTVLSK